MKFRIPRALAGLLGASMLAFAATAHAQQISILASAAFKEVLLELLPEFERTSSHKVLTSYSSSPDIVKRARAGEKIDLVILASDSLEELVRSASVIPGSRADLAKSGIGVAIRAGAAKPDIGSADAVKRSILAARSIAYSTGASGAYMMGLFQRLGIADEVRAKSRQTPPSLPVGELVARGEVELGFHQVSELLPVRGIEIVGPLPPELQQLTLFSGAIHVAASDPAAARLLLQYLASPAAMPVIRKHGMEPG